MPVNKQLEHDWQQIENMFGAATPKEVAVYIWRWYKQERLKRRELEAKVEMLEKRIDELYEYRRNSVPIGRLFDNGRDKR
jgi:hypothetical protein